MKEFISSFPNLVAGVITILATGLLSILIYYVRENISVIKKLDSTVSSILIRFAAHEMKTDALTKDVAKLEQRVDTHDFDLKNLKIDVVGLKSKIETHDKSQR